MPIDDFRCWLQVRMSIITDLKIALKKNYNSYGNGGLKPMSNEREAVPSLDATR